ncbi:PAS domain S-box protein [bacterium]|nr:PAS domain S-box protein [bacterium]
MRDKQDSKSPPNHEEEDLAKSLSDLIQSRNPRSIFHWEHPENDKPDDRPSESSVKTGLINLIEVVKDCVVLLDSELQVVTLNRAAETRFGIETHQAVGRHIAEISPEIKALDRLDKFRIVLETGKPFSLEEHASNGEHGTTVRLLKAFKVADGLGLIYSDITELKSAELSLRESNRLYQNLIESSPEAIILTDLNNNTMLANKQATEIFGFKNNAELISHVGDFSLLTESDEQERLSEMLHRVIDTGHTENAEFIMLEKDDSTLQVELSTTLISGVAGKPVALLNIIRRVAEGEQSDAESSDHIQQLEENVSELKQIISVTTHDLRSPLINIKGFSKELRLNLDEIITSLNYDEQSVSRRTPSQDSSDVSSDISERIVSSIEGEISEALSFIDASTTKMDSLLKGLSHISSLERKELNIVELDMNQLISEILKVFEYKLKELDINVKIDLGLPSCKGDEAQISQVFSNLIGNALKFIDPERTGEIQIYGWKKGRISAYCIEDTGVGIEEQHLSRIFEIFYRLDKTTTPGDGLGLTIARKILDRHSGKIWVESRVGSGSRFFVSLPSLYEANTAEKREVVIVIADADRGNALLLEKNLQRAGIANEMIHFSDGRETLDFLKNEGSIIGSRADKRYLLIIDLNLPEIEGIEVLQQIKEDNRLNEIPVIIMGTTDDNEVIERCRKSGCDDYFTKPFESENFIKALSKLGMLVKVVEAP